MSAYLVVDIEVTDSTSYEEYRKHVPALIAAQGGRYLVRGGRTELLEGNVAPNRTVILEFPSMEKLQAFYASAEYAPLKQLRIGASNSRVFAVEGL
ncbi:MAG TPA: DUF1330 domain-containing protein [Steroidobacteraceae bacterium]|jgi:uncharacterized protein (DUF1330 family)|nr:DUF1330 domain-containing protein [Steroidobacteraceae bacterium]